MPNTNCFNYHDQADKGGAAEYRTGVSSKSNLKMTLTDIQYNGVYKWHHAEGSEEDPVPGWESQLKTSFGRTDDPITVGDMWGLCSYREVDDSDPDPDNWTITNYLGDRSGHFGDHPWYSYPDQECILITESKFLENNGLTVDHMESRCRYNPDLGMDGYWGSNYDLNAMDTITRAVFCSFAGTNDNSLDFAPYITPSYAWHGFPYIWHSPSNFTEQPWSRKWWFNLGLPYGKYTHAGIPIQYGDTYPRSPTEQSSGLGGYRAYSPWMPHCQIIGNAQFWAVHSHIDRDVFDFGRMYFGEHFVFGSYVDGTGKWNMTPTYKYTMECYLDVKFEIL